MTASCIHPDSQNLLRETNGIGGDADKCCTSIVDEEYGTLLGESASELCPQPSARLYNSAGRMISAEPPAGVTTYTYNADGQRVGKTAPDNTTHRIILHTTRTARSTFRDLVVSATVQLAASR